MPHKSESVAIVLPTDRYSLDASVARIRELCLLRDDIVVAGDQRIHAIQAEVTTATVPLDTAITAIVDAVQRYAKAHWDELVTGKRTASVVLMSGELVLQPGKESVEITDENIALRWIRRMRLMTKLVEVRLIIRKNAVLQHCRTMKMRGMQIVNGNGKFRVKLAGLKKDQRERVEALLVRETV